MEPKSGTIKMSFELVVLPVTDVERAKRFYSELGWHCDIDHEADTGLRVVQFTPTGSAGSIMFGKDITTAAPGSVQGLYVIVEDVAAARQDLLERSIPVSELFHDEGGVFHRVGPEGRTPGPNPEHKSYASFASFKDPDGNTWMIQEVTARLGPDLLPNDVRFTPQIVKAVLG